MPRRLPRRPALRRSARVRAARLSVLVPVLALLASCERVKESLRGQTGDPAWQADSALVASKPVVLFRVIRDAGPTRIVPMATTGAAGFEPMVLGDRGWRLFDLEYLHRPNTVVPIRDGVPLPPVAIARGMWEGSPLDTIEGCNVMPPAALVDIPTGAELVASRDAQRIAGVTPISAAEQEEALTNITRLIAPSAGIAPSFIGRYQRRVYVVPTGASRTETIVVAYDDPETVPDSLIPMAQRPRSLVVVLDKGVYGFKPTYVFRTVGNNKDNARRRFLGAYDADGDGRAELFFGIQDANWPLVTYVIRWETDAWRESFKYERGRCHG